MDGPSWTFGTVPGLVMFLRQSEVAPLLQLDLSCMLAHLDILVVVLLIPESLWEAPYSSENVITFGKWCSDAFEFVQK